jgi:anti-sigma B factor antagonist
MEITALRDGEVGILALTGALDTLHAPALTAKATALSDAGTHTVLIDLAQVRYVTSAGFRSFIEIQRHAERTGGGVALCGLNELVCDLFEVSGFRNIFRVYPDRASALTAMAAQGVGTNSGVEAAKLGGEAS